MMRNGAWLGRVPLRGLGTTDVSDSDTGLVTTAQAVVLEFWMDGWVPCVEYKPVFDDVAARVPRDIMMASANVGTAAALAARYDVQGTPTTLFLSTGTEVNRLEGKLGADELLAAIQAAFPASFQSQTSTPAPAPTTTPPAPTGTQTQPRPQATQQPMPMKTSSGPTTAGIVAGVVGIALALAGVALIVGRKN